MFSRTGRACALKQSDKFAAYRIEHAWCVQKNEATLQAIQRAAFAASSP
jgi:hypothetical protein